MWVGPLYYVWYHLQASGPGLHKKTEWANHLEQANKHDSSMALLQFLSPGSFIALLAWLFIPKLLLFMVIYHNHRNPNSIGRLIDCFHNLAIINSTINIEGTYAYELLTWSLWTKYTCSTQVSHGVDLVLIFWGISSGIHSDWNRLHSF